MQAVGALARGEEHERSGHAADLAPIGPASDPHASLAGLDATMARFLRLAAAPPRSPAALLHGTAQSMHQFSAAILACEDAGLTRSTLLAHVAPLRALHSRSPFVHRLQTWPRGYAGDFETIEWLCDARNRAPAGTVEWAIEECALQSPVAQQHRNKVDLQARTILSAVVANPQARIASIGCGGCRDLSLIQDYMPAHRGAFVLVDADADALALAGKRLPQLAGRSQFVRGSVPRVLSRLADAEPFDLVVAGGLFDYLPDRWAEATLRGVRRMLAPGGRLLFSNIGAGNPFRPWIEYLGSWTLIERDEQDLQRLLTQAGFSLEHTRIFRDSTGLAMMANVAS